MIYAARFLFCMALMCMIFYPFPTKAQSSDFPKGKIEGPFEWKSSIYPGTVRDYWIYVPEQYDASKPACTMVLQDGLGRAKGWNLPHVMDSLIAGKEIPVIIGIFVDHGKVPAAEEDDWPRFNRCFEYDALGDRYARFLLEELLPEVGRRYNLSDDPNDRSIAGASSGAICAFNVAWERPDAFRRVLSTIGTYVGLRGGEEFPTLVRKTEPKPLRIFLEDGNTDLNIYAGDWWMANQDMLSALTWAGYEVNHIWGEEGHNSKGARKIMPQALTWLWKDYPEPVKTHPDQHRGRIKLLEGESWSMVNLEQSMADRIAINEKGDICVSNAEAKEFRLIDEQGKTLSQFRLGYRPGGMSFHADGLLYLADLDGKMIRAFDQTGKGSIVLRNVFADHMAISPKGIYWTDPIGKQIGFYDFEGKNIQYLPVPQVPQGLTITPDQTFLNVTASEDVFGYSYRIGEEGNLSLGQAFTHYHIPYGQMTAQPQGMTVDQDNYTYSATNMGIQVVDPLGRVNLIYAKPDGEATDVKIGGQQFDQLYLIAGGKLYKRTIASKGLLPWQAPIAVKKPGL